MQVKVKNVGQSENQQMFALSNQGEEERSQMISWSPRAEVGAPSVCRSREGKN